MAKGGKTGGDGGGSVAFAILGLDDISDTGVSNSDDLTTLSTGFTLTGTIDPSISSFSLLVNGVGYTVTDIDSAGDWTFLYDGPDLADGTVLVEASYTTIHPKNGKEQTTSAKPYTFDLDSTGGVVTNVVPPDMTLTLGVTEAGSFGNNFNGATDADGVVTATFTGTAGELLLSLTGYDVDSDTEIEVLLNGVSLGFLSTGVNNGLSQHSFTITAAQQIAGDNVISFVQTGN